MSTSTKSPSAKRPLQMHFGNRHHWNNALLKSSEQVRTGKTLMNRTMTTNRLLHQLARLVRRQPRLLNIRLVLLDFGAWKWHSSSSSATSAWIRRVTTTKIIFNRHRHYVNRVLTWSEMKTICGILLRHLFRPTSTSTWQTQRYSLHYACVLTFY